MKKFTTWIRGLFASNVTYVSKEPVFYYILVLLLNNKKYHRVYEINSPLHINDRIVLRDGTAFLVTSLHHVTYTKGAVTRLNRDKVFTHVELAPHPETPISEQDLLDLGFEVSFSEYGMRPEWLH